MGTTADKLSYLNETKTQIKTALETPYNVFRDYAALIKKYVDNQPTKKVTDGTCNNAVDLPVKTIEVDGNSEQNTYEGYQLLYLKDHTVTSNGVETTIKDNKINCSGTFNKDWANMSNSSDTECNLKANKTYTFVLNKSLPYELDFKYNSNIDIRIPAGSTYKTYKPTEDKIKLYLFIQSSIGTVVNISDLQVMIYEGEYDSSKSFEPYTGGMPSPNPDYPQEIEVIDGVNLLSDIGWERKAVLNETAIQDSTTRIMSDYIKIEETEDYYISIQNSDYCFINIVLYDKNKNQFGSYYNTVSQIINGAQNLKINFPNNTKYARFVIRNVDNTGEITLEELPIIKPMVCKGTTQKPYLPYGHIGLKQSGKNILQYNINTQTKNGVTLTDNNDGTYILNGTATANGYFYPSSDRYFKLPAGTYKFSSNKYENLVFAAYTDKSGTPVFWQSKDTTFTLLNDSDIFRMQISTIKDATYDNVVIKPMVRLATIEDDTFEPYHSPKLYPINLNGNSIAKVGDVKDLLKIYRNGDVEIEKNCNNYTFNESITILKSNDFSNSFFFYIDDSKNIYEGDTKVYVLCNYYISTYRNNILQYDYSIALSINKNIIIHDKDCNTVEEMKNKLKSLLNFKIIYATGSPKKIKLPSIDPIELWEGTNIFKLISNLETDFEVEYVTDSSATNVAQVDIQEE